LLTGAMLWGDGVSVRRAPRSSDGGLAAARSARPVVLFDTSQRTPRRKD